MLALHADNNFGNTWCLVDLVGAAAALEYLYRTLAHKTGGHCWALTRSIELPDLFLHPLYLTKSKRDPILNGLVVVL